MMTSTQSYSDHSTGFSLRFGISVGAISLLVIIIVASYICNYKRLLQHRGNNATSLDDQDSVLEAMELGVIDANFPKLQFSQAKLEKGSDAVGTCCSICLGEYKDEDWLLVLPDCGHMFHVDCVGAWLRLHGSCPVCRSSLQTVMPAHEPSLFTPFSR